MLKYLIGFIVVGFVFSCSPEKKEDNALSQEKINALPEATGDASDILVILDSAYQTTLFSQKLDSVLTRPYGGTITEEESFHVTHVTNANWDGFLRKRCLILIPILTEELINEEYFSALGAEVIEKVNNEESAFVFAKDHVYAKDQRVVFVVSKNQRTFLKQLKDQEENLIDILEVAAERRAFQAVFADIKTRNEIEIKKRKVSMLLPKELSLEIAKEGFVWYRKSEPDLSLNFCLSWMPLKDFFEIKDPVKYRNQELGKNLFANDDSTTFMTTEMTIEPVQKTIDFLGEKAVRTKGLWKLHNVAMGGSFVSLSFVDSQFKKFFYAEGFVFAPSKPKTDYLRAFTYLIKSIELN